MSIAGRRIVISISGTIDAGQTIDVDTVAWANFKALAYKIRLNDSAISVVRILEVRTSKNNSDVSDAIHSVLGDNIDVDTKVLKSGADVYLRLTNNEGYTVTYNILKTYL